MNQAAFKATLLSIGAKFQTGEYQIAAKLCRKGQIELKGEHFKQKNSGHSQEKGTEKNYDEESDAFWQLQSLRSVCLEKVQKSSMAIQILLTVLDNHPHHAPSMRRLASLFKKIGHLEKALEYFKLAQMYQPDNDWISDQILSLQPASKQKKSNLKMTSSYSLPTMEQESPEKQHVTFGSSQVVELVSEHSDEYIAHIKNQIHKLSENKPKKSILKTPSGTFYKETNYLQSQPQEKQEDNEKEVVSLTKSLSIKSCGATMTKFISEEYEEEEKEQKGKFVSSKKEKKKKKGVSFSFTESED